jgi:lipopolysaccharide biosynthesis protein
MQYKKKIAICFHLGYHDLFYQFTQYIDNVLNYDNTADLYITYQCDESLLVDVKNKYPSARYYKTMLGCDTGAFLYCMNEIDNLQIKYKYIFKIHTKKNYLWRIGMLDPLSNVNNIINTFSKHRKIGMIGASNFKSKYVYPNRNIIHNILRSMNIIVARRAKFEFLAGTIFWMKGRVVRKFIKIIKYSGNKLINFYNLCEVGYPNEPSYTHSWERIFGYMVHITKYKKFYVGDTLSSNHHA